MTERDVVQVHGRPIAVRVLGDEGAPVVALVHGIASDADSWGSVPDLLAERAGVRVVVPELFAAGGSVSGNQDFSLGSYAAGLRDVLFALGHGRATVIGHSLGGGVAMQYAYLFPHLVERLALVSSGGLGRGVSPLLTAATLPGAELVVPLLAARHVRGFGSLVLRACDAVARYIPGASTAEWHEVGRGIGAFADPSVRLAFLSTVRHVLDLKGQRISARDRLPYAADVPVLLVHGDRDRIIPERHSARAHAEVPGSRYAMIPNAGHYPHLEQPELFMSALLRWMSDTEPAQLDEDVYRERLRMPVPL